MVSRAARTRSSRGPPSGRRARPRPPAPGGCRGAADGRVAVHQQGVGEYAVLGDVRVDVVLRPAGDRRDLYLAALLVPADDRGVRPGRGLVAAQARRPGAVLGEPFFEGLDLAERAAQVGVAVVQLRPVLGVLLGHGLARGERDDVDVHHGLDRVPGADGLLEVVAGVEEDDVHAGPRAGGEMGDHRVLHRGGHAELLAEGVDRPLEDLQGGGVLQVAAGLLGESPELGVPAALKIRIGIGIGLNGRHISSPPPSLR